jgi:hypothetical protein
MTEVTAAVPLDSVLSIAITSNTSIIRGSGVLFSSGLYVLTAAHLFDDYMSDQSIDIVSANGAILNDAQISIHHGWNSTNTDFNHDLAIIKLSSAAATAGLSLWGDANYDGVSFTLTGFDADGALHTGTNIFDGDGALFNAPLNKSVVEGTQVIYDYDNGLEQQNTSNGFFNVSSTVMPTDNETIARSGNSGGALLVDNQIAAISSYISSNQLYDVNAIADSSFGEVGAATNVTAYIPWIEYITQGNPIYSAPDTASTVITGLPEPFSDSVLNYFLLEMSTASLETVRLKYITRDGTATAGNDYNYTEGFVELAPSETHIAIGVTIYGDIEPEADETFSLVITDPTGQWLDANVELIASHTIINNDLFSV